MKKLNIIGALFISLFCGSVIASDCSGLLDIDVRKLNDKQMINLCESYQGKVLLIVNTASRCAYTNQYESLEKLYNRYKDDGLVVLGFPSNDFGHQEPGSETEIREFCSVTYGVDFPMFAKTRVTERHADPLYQRLAAAAGTYPKWNFHKYLIGPEGELVASYQSALDPLDVKVVSAVEEQLRRVRF